MPVGICEISIVYRSKSAEDWPTGRQEGNGLETARNLQRQCERFRPTMSSYIRPFKGLYKSIQSYIGPFEGLRKTIQDSVGPFEVLYKST